MAISLSPAMAVHLPDCELSLDRPGSFCYLSHAHSDHASGISPTSRIIATPETLALRSIGSEGVHYNRSVKIASGVKAVLRSAGHILGSSILRIEDGASFEYTGDFCLSDGALHKAAEPEHCDIMLVESTYGSPEWRFPPRQEVAEQMGAWASNILAKGGIGLIGGYVTGKSQELIAILNQAGIAPVVTTAIDRVCTVYDRFGCKLDRIAADSLDADSTLSGPFIAVVPQNRLSYLLASRLHKLYRRPVFTAMATGWGLHYRFPVDKVFVLSDHADFHEIVEYVAAAGPKRVLTCHGYDKELAAELRKKGFNAVPLREANQKQLAEFA